MVARFEAVLVSLEAERLAEVAGRDSEAFVAERLAAVVGASVAVVESIAAVEVHVLETAIVAFAVHAHWLVAVVLSSAPSPSSVHAVGSPAEDEDAVDWDVVRSLQLQRPPEQLELVVVVAHASPSSVELDEGSFVGSSVVFVAASFHPSYCPSGSAYPARQLAVAPAASLVVRCCCISNCSCIASKNPCEIYDFHTL